MEKILVVEDDFATAALLKVHLEKAGFSVMTAGDGLEGLRMARDENPNFILLDLVLPYINGMEICKTLRMERVGTPILILTASDELYDKILSLELGADDFLTKPFDLREVTARIKAILRRITLYRDPKVKNSEENLENVYPLKFSNEAFEVILDSNRIELTKREYELLRYLARNSGKVLTRDELMNEVWSDEYNGDTRVVDVHVSHLRKKLKDYVKEAEYIKTIRGRGYFFDPRPSVEQG